MEHHHGKFGSPFHSGLSLQQGCEKGGGGVMLGKLWQDVELPDGRVASSPCSSPGGLLKTVLDTS